MPTRSCVCRLTCAARGSRRRLRCADPATDPQIAQWMAVAQGYWHAAPNCPDGLSIQRAQWLPDPGVWAAAVQGGCAVAFDPDFYPAPAGYDAGWYQAAMCSVVAHEWGHLLGYGHVADPNNLMNPVTPINIVDGCPTWGLASANSDPPLAQTQPPTQATKTAPRRRRRPRRRRARRAPARPRPAAPSASRRRSAARRTRQEARRQAPRSASES